jgi:hypothetical protein
MTLHQLPDLTFHTQRYYMTTGAVNGEKMIIYVASCKEQGCNSSLRHLTRHGRDRLVWEHRREQILTNRVEVLGQLFDDQELIDEMGRLANKHTHDFYNYLAEVDKYMVEVADVKHDTCNEPEKSWTVYYQVGFSAKDAADRVLSRTMAYQP